MVGATASSVSELASMSLVGLPIILICTRSRYPLPGSVLFLLMQWLRGIAGDIYTTATLVR